MDVALDREVVAIKFVITGPFAAGKTTLVKTMSEIPVVGTETIVTDDTSAIKTNTTVSLDFGKLVLADDDLLVELSLFGTPGQARFSFMWDVLAEGMDGYVVLTDVSRPEALEETQEIVRHFQGIADVPFVIGANRHEDHPHVLEDLDVVLGVPGAPIVPCNATDPDSARQMLLALLEAVLAAEEAA